MRYNLILPILLLLFFSACSPKPPEEINIGFIGPLTGNAVDLGEEPSKAIAFAIEEYNQRRTDTQPKVNLFIEDGHWNGENAIPLYEKLRTQHGIEILLLSHTDGTIALQEKALEDKVILINSLNNDALLSSMNENTFMIGKKTEEAAQVVAGRILELGLKKVGGFYVTNNFMTISADAFSQHLTANNVAVELLPVDIEKEDYTQELQNFSDKKVDSFVFFGYKNLGFAMKQARDLKIDAPFFASTTTLGKGYYENSEGALKGTEFSYFTVNDGNYVVATEFVKRYSKRYGAPPFSVWPTLQAYDAISIVLGIIGTPETNTSNLTLDERLKKELLKTNYYQGVCGNLAILEDGSSRGIYFSLYLVKGNGVVEKVKR